MAGGRNLERGEEAEEGKKMRRKGVGQKVLLNEKYEGDNKGKEGKLAAVKGTEVKSIQGERRDRKEG